MQNLISLFETTEITS